MEGQVQKFLLGIVAVLILLSVIGATIGTIDTSTDEIGVDQRCDAAACFYNSSRTVDCTASNVTAGDTTACADTTTQGAFLGESLFTGGLLTTIVLLVSLMIIVGVAWIKAKNR